MGVLRKVLKISKMFFTLRKKWFFQELITERFFGNPNAVLLWQTELVREILVALETRQISKFDSDSEALNSVRFDSAQFPLIQLICVKFKL